MSGIKFTSKHLGDAGAQSMTRDQCLCQVVDRDHSPARFHHEDQRQALSKAPAGMSSNGA